MKDGSGAVHSRLSPRVVPWLRSWRAGLISLDDLVAELTSGDLAGVEQVVVTASDPTSARGLTDGLATLSGVPQEQVRVVLPVPGDARGLPRAGEFAAEALTQGEGIVAGVCGIVPCRRTHTSGSGDEWDTVDWLLFNLPEPPLPPEPVSLAEADMALSQAVRDAVRVLADLDVASWNPELGRALATARGGSERPLPRGFDPRARRLYARSMLLESALRVAGTDAMGGAVNAFEAASRAEALRPLAASCRQAIAAVCHAQLGC